MLASSGETARITPSWWQKAGVPNSILTCSWSRGWIVSSQSLMRWLSSVSWTNFWEVAMKSSYGRTSVFFLHVRAQDAPLLHP